MTINIFSTLHIEVAAVRTLISSIILFTIEYTVYSDLN